MKRILFCVVLLLTIQHLSAQDSIQYIAAKNGVTLREKPSPAAKALGKLNYAEKIIITQYSVDTITIEGFRSDWVKVKSGTRIGYVVTAYLFSVPPPATTVKTISDYINQLAKPAGKPVIYGNTDESAEEAFSAHTKTLFNNGAIIHEWAGYESRTVQYVLPGFDLQSTFQLLRLIPEFSSLINPSSYFPHSSRQQNGVSIKVQYGTEEYSMDFIQKITFYKEGDAGIENLEIFEINGEMHIIYETGV